MASINDEHQAGYRATHPGFHFDQPAQNVTGGTAVSRAHKRIENSVKGMKAHAEYVDTRTDLGPEEKRLAVEAYARTEAGRDAIAAVAEVEERRELAAAKVTAERAKLTPQRDTAGELRAQAIRDRALRKLDAADSSHVAAAARGLIENAASPEELGVLAEEVVPYLEAKGAPTDWVDPVIATEAADYAAARAELAGIDQALSVTRSNAAMARQGIEAGRVVTHLVDPSRFDIDAQ